MFVLVYVCVCVSLHTCGGQKENSVFSVHHVDSGDWTLVSGPLSHLLVPSSRDSSWILSRMISFTGDVALEHLTWCIWSPFDIVVVAWMVWVSLLSSVIGTLLYPRGTDFAKTHILEINSKATILRDKSFQEMIVLSISMARYDSCKGRSWCFLLGCRFVPSGEENNQVLFGNRDKPKILPK